MKNHNMYIAGVPDVWYSGNKNDLWIEYKYLPIQNPRTSITPNLSELQKKWINDRRNEGRNVWVIIGCKDGGVILHNNYGLSPKEFKNNKLTRRELAIEIMEFTHETKEHQIKSRKP